MRILGIDPGFERLGIAILDKKNNQKENLVFSECFKTDKKLKLNTSLSLPRSIDGYLANYIHSILAYALK